MPQADEPGPSLYGITTNNCSRSGDDLWGKNQFNSVFPLSLCLYMRDNGISPVSVRLVDGRIATDDAAWEMDAIIPKEDAAPFFHLEAQFEPYRKLFRNEEKDKIDLVISVDDEQVTPIEIKLTVSPDSTTLDKRETEWAPEIVIRPVSSAYAMMGIASRLNKFADAGDDSLKKEVLGIMKPTWNKITDWNNETEVNSNAISIHSALRRVLKTVEDLQKPFLIQPIWRTKWCGKKRGFVLCEQCFDVFAWSDVAMMMIPVEESSAVLEDDARKTRAFREVARHLRGMHDILQGGDLDYSGIYKGMGYRKQTDKAFTVSGTKSIKYLKHERLNAPILPRSLLNNIVLNSGELELKPERRFDAAVRAHIIEEKDRALHGTPS